LFQNYKKHCPSIPDQLFTALTLSSVQGIPLRLVSCPSLWSENK